MADSLVAGWLTELNLTECIKTFREEGIDSEALTGLDDAQLKVLHDMSMMLILEADHPFTGVGSESNGRQDKGNLARLIILRRNTYAAFRWNFVQVMS